MNDPQRRAQGASTSLIYRKTFDAHLVSACPHCGAPGVWKSITHPGCSQAEVDNYKRFPGILVAPTDGRVNQVVGDVCPNCGGQRHPNRHVHHAEVKL